LQTGSRGILANSLSYYKHQAPGPSSICSTMQYTFPGNLRPIGPFESRREKLQTTNKIRHFKHVC
jgi:hypothetical protein